jgi:hypothetical protein
MTTSIIATLSGRISATEATASLQTGTPEQHFLQAMAAAAAQILFETAKTKGLQLTAVSYKSRLLVTRTQLAAPTHFGCISTPGTYDSRYTVEENFVIEGDIAPTEIALLKMHMELRRTMNLPFIAVSFKSTFAAPNATSEQTSNPICRIR